MRKMILWTSLAFALMMPASGAAVTEGVVEAAPQVEVEMSYEEGKPSYLPDGSYYAGYGDWLPAWEDSPEWVESRFDGECYHDVEQRPRMTSGEAKRAKALLQAYQKGEITYTGESVLNKMENVVVGVYALAPESYDGEHAYVILPGPCMTDEQLLAVIDAHAQMGLTFDPDALNYRNCARGGGIETSRFLTEEESERYGRISKLIRRGLLSVADMDTSGILRVKLDARYFCGMTDFSLRPYCRMTDEEMTAALVEMGVHDQSTETDFDDVERRARNVLNNWLGAPLSMEFSQIYLEGGYVPKVFDAQGNEAWIGEGRMSYGADFTYYTEEGILVYAHSMFDKETNQLVSASVMHDHPDNYGVWPEPGRPVTQEEIDAAIDEFEKQTGIDSLTWHVCAQDMTWTNWGECLPVRAQLTEGEWLTLYIGTDDGKLHGAQMECGETVDKLPAQDMPVNG
ncbi:MAG: hypothetical protein IJ381_06100 [Clostridia bacterium]|nr:hypothetical protein [Clostridia bacterium]